jgi:hypothetical protein
VQEGVDLLARDLLLEQRSKHEHGGTRILELLHHVEIVPERPAPTISGWGRRIPR